MQTKLKNTRDAHTRSLWPLVRAFTAVEAMIGVVILGLLLFLVGYPIAYVAQGCGSFGPAKTQDVTVQRLYVDSGSNESGSHYMVGTDKGVFEVENGWLLGLWNADELYSKMKDGHRYRITTKGNKVVGFFFQEYPYVTAVEALP